MNNSQIKSCSDLFHFFMYVYLKRGYQMKKRLIKYKNGWKFNLKNFDYNEFSAFLLLGMLVLGLGLPTIIMLIFLIKSLFKGG